MFGKYPAKVNFLAEVKSIVRGTVRQKQTAKSSYTAAGYISLCQQKIIQFRVRESPRTCLHNLLQFYDIGFLYFFHWLTTNANLWAIMKHYKKLTTFWIIEFANFYDSLKNRIRIEVNGVLCKKAASFGVTMLSYSMDKNYIFFLQYRTEARSSYVINTPVFHSYLHYSHVTYSLKL